MKSVIIGATLVAGVAAAPERKLQTLESSHNVVKAGGGWPVKPKYFFDFGNPKACIDNSKTVLDFEGKAKLKLKGGNPKFICNPDWVDSATVPATLQAKYTPIPTYALNYSAAGAATPAPGGVSCPSQSDQVSKKIHSCTPVTGGVEIVCMDGYWYGTAGAVTDNANSGIGSANKATVTTGTVGSCADINECTSSATAAVHRCNADHATCTNDAAGGYTCGTCAEHPTLNPATGAGMTTSYGYNNAAICDGASCNALLGTKDNNGNPMGTAAVSATVYSANSKYYTTNSQATAGSNGESAVTYTTITLAAGSAGCGQSSCQRIYETTTYNEVKTAAWYNASNYTNTSFWENCTASPAPVSAGNPAGASATGGNCTNGTIGDYGNCTMDPNATASRLLTESSASRRRLAANDSGTNGTTAGTPAGSPVAGGMPANRSMTTGPEHYYQKTAGATVDQLTAFNVLNFDGKGDYAEIEFGDMTGGLAMGSSLYEGSTYATIADASGYAKVGTEGSKDLLKADTGAATYMFTFATTEAGKQALLEGYGPGKVGTMNLRNGSNTDFAEINSQMQDLLQIQLDSANVYVRSFGQSHSTDMTTAQKNKNPLVSGMNFINYKSGTVQAAATTVTEDSFVTIFVTTGTSAGLGDVFEATTEKKAEAKTGHNCNYPQTTCSLPTTWATAAAAGTNGTSSRRLSTVDAIKTGADACNPDLSSAGSTLGVPPMRKAQRVYALGRQQFTPKMDETKAKDFSTCANNCCCSAYQNVSAAGQCGTGNPNELHTVHYDYFKGKMRNFAIFDSVLTAANMDDIIDGLKIHTKTKAQKAGDSSTSTSGSASPSGGDSVDGDLYWHACKNVFNESHSCMANDTIPYAERVVACDGKPNTTECEEFSNSLLPIWNFNPATAKVTCDVEQVKFELRFKVNASTVADLTACLAAGTCLAEDGTTTAKIPTLTDLMAMPGSGVGYNLTAEIGDALAYAIGETLENAMNDDETCTEALTGYLLDADPTNTVAETKTITAPSGKCPKKFYAGTGSAARRAALDWVAPRKQENAATDNYYCCGEGGKGIWLFPALTNETDSIGNYGLTLDNFVEATESQTALPAAQQVVQTTASNLADAFNATSGELTIGVNTKMTFTFDGITTNVADIISESNEDEMYSDLIAPLKHKLDMMFNGAGLAGMVKFDGIEKADVASGFVRNANVTLSAQSCTVTDHLGRTYKAGGGDISSSPSPSGTTDGATTDGASTAGAGTATAGSSPSPAAAVAAKKKKSSNAFRSTGVSALATLFAVFALFLSTSRQ